MAAAVLLFPTIFWPFDYDQGTFAYGGWGVLHGLRPYLDFWDIKPPNIFYTYAAAFTLFGDSVRAVRIFDYLNALLSLALLYVLATRLWKDFGWDRIAAIFASLAFVVQYYIFGSWNTAQTETYSIPLLLGAMLCVVPSLPAGEEALPRTRALWAGILIGISFYFKFPNALFLLLAAVAIWMFGREKQVTAIVWLVAGFIVAIGLESLYLGMNGELLPLWNLTTSETASYVSSNYSGSFTVLRNLRASLQALDGLWVAAGILGLLVWGFLNKWRDARRATFRSIALALLGCVLALIVVQAENKGYTYHYGILLPWADLLIGAGIGSLLAILSKLDRIPVFLNALALGIVLVLGSFFWSSRNPLQGRVAELMHMARGIKPVNGYIAGDSIAEYVTRHTHSNDRIFIFGFAPYVYWKTGLAPASKFINTIHFKSRPVPLAEREELVHDLIGNPPALFLVETLDKYTSQGNSDADSRSTIRFRYPELEQLLDSQYRPRDTIDGTILYQRDGVAE